VIINGKIILSNGKFLGIDKRQLITEANKRSLEIYQNASDDWKTAGSKMVKDVEAGYL
jgi:hypothetical protein